RFAGLPTVDFAAIGLQGGTVEIPPDAAIITIKGFCPNSAASGKDNCQSVVTRAQFDLMASSIQTSMSPEVKHQLAESYPKLLVMAAQAEKRGLDKGPRYEERMRFARLQILSQEMVRQIQLDSADVSEKEIDAYYQAHSQDFEQASFQRI